MKRLSVGLILALFLVLRIGAESLEHQFKNPPEQSRPWCYWYWISNHISKEGVTKDLEAMAEVGIGTALIGNQYFAGQEGPVSMLSEAWWDITVHAVREGKRLGVDIGLFNSPGWSQSGGPWVKPEQAMRYIVSTETRVTGPRNWDQVLPKPDGDFQDVAVLAVPVSKAAEKSLSSRHPKITAVPTIGNVEKLVDGDPDTSASLNLSKGGEQSIELRVDRSFEARTFILTPGDAYFLSKVTIEAWVDGAYRVLREGNYDRRKNSADVGPMPRGPVYISVPPTASNRFRLRFNSKSAARGKGGHALAEIEILSAPRVEYAVEKQLGKMHPTPAPQWGDYHWPAAPQSDASSAYVDPEQVYDLTDRMDQDGRLQCKIPAGDWVIQRIGMLPTGTVNSPAAPNATGPEVDKMSRKHLDAHFDAFVGELLKRLAPDEKTALKYVVADSYEKGSQNWTDDLAPVFQETYGYDPLPYLPVLSGRVVKDPESSDRFLWDLRRLVADQLADVYATGLRERSNEHGLKTWLENYGHWGFPGEFMRYGGACDLVAGEFWATGTLGNIECRASASTAHAYGKKVCYAEALTSGSNWELTPYKMKARGDWAFTEGINHFVLHLYIQQPDERRPGINAWFGTEFNRHSTWFYEGRDWIDYLRRCHVMLQQGLHVADFAYFIGEDTPIMTGTRHPEQPIGYDFDFINAEVLLERMTIQNGRWTLPDGKSYSVLVLPPLKTMRPAVLEKLRAAVEAGGVLYGEAPEQSPSLQHAVQADEQIRNIAATMWQGMTIGESGIKVFGKGKIIQGLELNDVVQSLALPADVTNINPEKTLWTHRQLDDADIYFLSNQQLASVQLDPVFRVPKDRAPELWHADTGRMVKTAHYEVLEKGIRVPVSLGPAGSVFVVFKKSSDPAAPSIVHIQGPEVPKVHAEGDKRFAYVKIAGPYSLQLADGTLLELDEAPLPEPVELDEKSWRLAFMPDLDMPESIQLDTLLYWTELDEASIVHYSGTGGYLTSFDMPEKSFAQRDLRFELDLGRVEPMARVYLNGKDLGLLWKPPFVIDVTEHLKPGKNELRVDVTNLWSNRLVGELKYPDGFPGKEKQTFTPFWLSDRRVKANRALQPSGLAGPVRVQAIRKVPVQK